MRKLFLLLLTAMTCIMTGCAAREYDLPERVSFYREGEILLIGSDELIAGCLMSGMPSADEEALKAAACVMSTRMLYLLRHRELRSFNGADISADDLPLAYMTDMEACEEYGASYDLYRERAQRAAEYGLSHVMTCGGEVISPELCLLSAGRTDADRPNHRAVPLSCDKEHAEYLSSSEFSPDEVRRRLTALTGVGKLSGRCEEWFSGYSCSTGGALKELRFGGCRVTGEQLRDTFQLRSTAVTISYTEGRFVFTCKGIGENRGLSLNGADHLAEKGYSAQQILDVFFSDITLSPCGIS